MTLAKKAEIAVRILLGALFLFGGVAFFFTTPPPLTGSMATFFQGLQASRYFFFLLKGTEIVCGLALVSGLFVPLALVVLAPIVVNIVLVHVFLDPSGLPVAAAVLAAFVYLAFFSPTYSPVLRRLLAKKPA